MAEPLTITGTTLCLALNALNVCKSAYSLIQGIRGCPKAIQRLSVDVHGLCHVLDLLHTALSAETVTQVRLPLHMVLDLELLLDTCRTLCQDVISVVSQFVGSDGKPLGGIWKSFKWEMFKKNDVAALQDTLGMFKLTINMACASLTYATGSRTNAIVEQIQKDVKTLRNHAERQERQEQELAQSTQDDNTVSEHSFASESRLSRLSIMSYNLPIRRFLAETESLVGADITHIHSSNGGVSDEPRADVSIDVAMSTVQPVDDAPQMIGDSQGTLKETLVERPTSVACVENIQISTKPTEVMDMLFSQIQASGHSALCHHLKIEDGSLSTKFMPWRLFNEMQLGPLLHTTVCSTAPKFAWPKISFLFEKAHVMCDFFYGNRLTSILFIKPYMVIDEPNEIWALSQLYRANPIEHSKRFGIRTRWSISRQSNDNISLWFRHRSTRDKLLELLQQRIDGGKPSTPTTARSLDESVKETLKDLNWTALSERT